MEYTWENAQAQRRDSAKIRVVVLPSIAGRRPGGATAPRLGFLLYDRVRVGEGVKNSAAGKGVLGPRSLEYWMTKPERSGKSPSAAGRGFQGSPLVSR